MEKTAVLLCIKDGKIASTPTDNDAPAIIYPVPAVDIYINNRLIQEPAEVFSTEEIRIVPKTIVVDPGSLDLRVSENRLEAYLTLKMKKIIRYTLADQPDTQSLSPVVSAAEIAEPICTLPELLAVIEKKGIIHGLKSENIRQAYANMSDHEVLIAIGTPSQPGTDASITCHFCENQPAVAEIDQHSRIDYRDKGKIPHVSADQLLAEKTPAEPGLPGKTVLGEIIEPAPCFDAALLAGSNTYFDNSKLKLYASVLGHPGRVSNPSGSTIHVEPVVVIQGDVNLETGHLWFLGDLSILGKITEHMEVYCGGSLKVREGITSATVVAEGHVTVQENVINSSILAGAQRFFMLQVEEPLHEFSSTFLSVLKAYQQIREKSPTKQLRFGYVLNMLVENKFNSLPEQMSALETSLEIPPQTNLMGELQNEIEILQRRLQKFHHFVYQDAPKAIELLQTAERVQSILRSDHLTASSIQIPYCLNAKIKASGDIVIAGQGSFHSEIQAHGAVKITGTVRGGTVESGQSLFIEEVGSDAAIASILAVPKDSTISIGKVYENTIVRFGQFVHRIQEKDHRIKIQFSKKANSVQFTHY
jgi:uncharacterized protein